MFVRATDKVPIEAQPGMIRSLLAHGRRLMLVEVVLRQGTRVPAHSHPHEQASYVVRGTVQFTVGADEFVLAAGESCLIPSEHVHSAEALSESTLVDAFSPPRADFLDGPAPRPDDGS